jgi:hypothetical protein
MTDTAFPFGEADPGDGTPDSDRRKLMLVAVAGGLVVLLVAAYFLVLRGGGDASTESFVPRATPAKHVATAAKKPAAKHEARKHVVKVPQTFNDVVGRDPFRPLVVEAASTGTTGTGTTTGTTSGSPTTDLGDSTGTTTTPVGQRVSLIRIYTKNGHVFATTKVGSVVYNPGVGTTFARTFQLVSVDGSTATYLDGDVQFSLREGQEVLK